jgi:hypothetical protein
MRIGTPLAIWAAAAILAAGPGPVIALHPLDLPDGLTDAGARTAIEAEIEARLRTAGYTVVPSLRSGEIWDRRLREAGGFYDPLTGDTIPSKYRQVRNGTVRELRERFGVTAWLRGRVEVLVVRWRGGRAEWDAVSEGVAPVGQGRVGALTLVVAVEDTAGIVLAQGRGGVQVLAKVKGDRYVPVPDDQLLKDSKRISRSVELALRPLLGSSRP